MPAQSFWIAIRIESAGQLPRHLRAGHFFPFFCRPSAFIRAASWEPRPVIATVVWRFWWAFIPFIPSLSAPRIITAFRPWSTSNLTNFTASDSCRTALDPFPNAFHNPNIQQLRQIRGAQIIPFKTCWRQVPSQI